jgi:hypothetical protein
MDKVYTQEEVAERYHQKPQTMAAWRHQGKGPAWFRAGKTPMYREAALAAWEKTQEAPQAAERQSA